MDILLAIPNVSVSCPANTCPAPMRDGTWACMPCLPDSAPGIVAADVPALDTWAMLVLAAALALAGAVKSKS